MCSSAILRDHDFHRDCRITFTLFPKFASRRRPYRRFSQFSSTEVPNSSGCNKSQYRQASIKLLSNHLLYIRRSTFLLWLQKCTAISLAVARFTSVTAATAREAREMYSVSIVSFGAELGWPSIRLMFNSSHNITKRFPSRCFDIKSAGLTVPRIFSILSSWFFSFSCGQKYFVSVCLIAPLPLRRASPHAAAASVQPRT